MENPRRIENELNAESLVLETGGCRIFAQQPRWVVFDEKAPSNGWHVHSVYEACLCLRGRGSFLCGSETAAFGPGDIFLGSPGLPHQITKEGAEETELFFFVFRPEREGRGDGSAEGDLLRRFLEEGCPILAKGGPGALFFSDWFRAARGGTHAPAFRAMETALLLECLGALVGSAGERTQERLAIDYIAAHLREHIAVPELARLLSLSERGVYDFFRSRFGVPPAKYIAQMRIAEAKGYLRMGFDVAEAAERAGFADASSFCHAFRRETGLTPARYRGSG